MILAVDIGNSNIVIGGIEEMEILFEARLRTDSTKTSDEYCIDLKNILDIYGVERSAVEGAIVASVVPQVLNSIKTAGGGSRIEDRSEYQGRESLPDRSRPGGGCCGSPAGA